MDRNNISEIDDDNSSRGFDCRKHLKISLNKGLDFLLNNQLNYGEFKTEICKKCEDPSGAILEEWIFDSSPFATALIFYCVSFLETDERVQRMKGKGLKFLMSEMEEGGLWRYWSSINEKHKMIPPDLDDICCISHILKKNNVPFPENIEVILDNKNKQGIFYTWLLLAYIQQVI